MVGIFRQNFGRCEGEKCFLVQIFGERFAQNVSEIHERYRILEGDFVDLYWRSFAQEHKISKESGNVKNSIKIGASILWTFLPFLWVASCSNHPVEVGQNPSQSVRDPASTGEFRFDDWSYDRGPDPKDPLQRKLIEINTSIPYFPGVSQAILGKQKFRPIYGPIPWRMRQEPNSVSILFIGQDGTHIAEASGRPATAGFGGRAQDLARHFGVSSRAAFMNAFAFTIKGQYGDYQAPVISGIKTGKSSLQFSSPTDNYQWLLAQDQDSPITKWRNSLINYIINNNNESLRLIVLFGGAANDAAGGFLESFKDQVNVGAKYTSEDLANIKVPVVRIVGTGGNGEAPIPVTVDGKDYYAELVGHSLKYSSDQKTGMNPDLDAGKKAMQDAFKKDPDAVMKRLKFVNGGINGSGIVHPAQIGGYDLESKLSVAGVKGFSLKGLVLPNGVKIKNDILVVHLPHPSSLSKMSPPQASAKVNEALRALESYVQKGWTIDEKEYVKDEKGHESLLENSFAHKKPYAYGRAHMGPEYYDFGAPASRIVDKSDASRMTGKPNVIVFGTRAKVNFDGAKVSQMTNAKYSKMPPTSDMWIMRPRNVDSPFDAGPNPTFAKLMKDLPAKLGDDPKQSINSDYAHYRGTFNNPRVLIVADPMGFDDLITARALTGSRGQYLNGVMEDLGVGDKYLVLKTAPYSFIDAGNWSEIVAATNSYRENLLAEVLKNGTPEVILADGDSAVAEVKRILGGKGITIVNVQRQGEKADAGILEAAAQLEKISGFKGRASGKMSDIPRSHLSYYARTWEGTSGDRVITASSGPFVGLAFAEVVPAWAYQQKYTMPRPDAEGIQALLNTLSTNHMPLGLDPTLGREDGKDDGSDAGAPNQ